MAAARPSPPLVPPPLRRPAGSAAVIAMIVFGVFAARYEDGTTARWLDRRVQSLVESSGGGGALVDVVIRFGGAVPVVVLAVLLSGLALASGHRHLAVLAIVGPGLTGVATTLLKPVIGRTFNGAPAFPSGHTGGATALGMIAALLLICTLRTARSTSAILLAVGAVGSGGTMAVALIAGRDHYPTDTLGGFCLAVAVVLSSALVIESWREQRDRPRH